MNNSLDAWQDIKAGFSNPFWWILSLNDIKSRYRRTVFGPWWLIIGTGAALVSIAFVWSALFNMDISKLFPYLSIGYVLWMTLSSFLTEGCGTFTNGIALNLQQNYVLPKSIHVYRLVGRAFLIFLHNSIIFILGAIIFGVSLNTWTLMAVPGFLVFLFNGIWLSTLLGLVAARFRDIEPLIGSLLTLIFLVSPIIWHVDALGARGHIAAWNPVTHYLAIVRDPLLGQPPSLVSWLTVITFTALGSILAFLLFSRFKNRVAFWL